MKDFSCLAYNNVGCSLDLGSVFTKQNQKTYSYKYNNKNYIIRGFSTINGGNIKYKVTEEPIALDLSDTTIYVNSVLISDILSYKNKTVYVENSFRSTTVTRLDQICLWAPYLCNVPGKMFVFSSDSYYIRWSGSAGVYYPNNDNTYKPIDVIASPGQSGNSNDAWMHEMGHSWDYYYDIKTGKRISNQADFQKLYKYYVNNNGANKDEPANEFFAAMMPTYVYFKNNIDGSTYNFQYKYWKQFVNSTTEEKLKKYMICVFDKYVKISNGNYNTNTTVTGCSFPY